MAASNSKSSPPPQGPVALVPPGDYSHVPAGVMRENALRRAPFVMGLLSGEAVDAANAEPAGPGGTGGAGGAGGVATIANVPAQPIAQQCVVNEIQFTGNITLSDNPKRVYLFVQNQGVGTMFFSTIQTGTLTSGGRIPVGGTYEPAVCMTNQLSITGTGIVLEGSAP